MNLDIDKEMAEKMIALLQQVVDEPKKPAQKVTVQKKKKRGRPPKKKHVPGPVEMAIAEEADEVENSGTQKKRIRKRRSADAIHSSKKGKSQKNKRAKIEPLSVGTKRENKFFTMIEEDIDIAREHRTKDKGDSLLYKGIKPRPRRDAVELVEVECDKCHIVEEVFPSAITSRSRYLCNDCSCGK